MRRPIFALAVLVCALPGIAAADSPVSGDWRISGSVSGHPFTLDCRFTPAGAGFGGTCSELASGGSGHPGKVHTLTKGTLAGDHVIWAYPVTAMFMTFDMTFEGTVEGARITGTASAAGRKGSFAAAR